ncbi:MAG TPA: hypothetical protein VNJ51_10760 [Candidatus Dormibacteraeota bacterium]|nr:hypothetical protein [Candidatus Dormibacteraeota bacterium]
MHVQRAIEANGVPTILITVEPTQSAQARPPRAVQPVNHQLGWPVGPEGAVEVQRKTVEHALRCLLHPVEPGTIQTYED